MVVVEPTHLKKYDRQIGFIFPNFRGERKKYLKPLPSVKILDFLFFLEGVLVTTTKKQI